MVADVYLFVLVVLLFLSCCPGFVFISLYCVCVAVLICCYGCVLDVLFVVSS